MQALARAAQCPRQSGCTVQPHASNQCFRLQMENQGQVFTCTLFQALTKRHERDREKERDNISESRSTTGDCLTGSKKTEFQAAEPHRPGGGSPGTSKKGHLQGCPPAALHWCWSAVGLQGREPTARPGVNEHRPSPGGREVARATRGRHDGQRCSLRRRNPVAASEVAQQTS